MPLQILNLTMITKNQKIKSTIDHQILKYFHPEVNSEIEYETKGVSKN